MVEELPAKIKTRADLAVHITALTERHDVMARAFALGGQPPLRLGRGGLPALAGIIIGQQISRAAADAIEARLVHGLGGEITAQAIVTAGREGLGELGLTRAKARALHGIAVEVGAGRFSFRQLSRMGEEQARTTLTALPGIGPWSAEIYLLGHLGHADIFPAGDLALQKTWGALAGKARPGTQEMAAIAESWAPSRAVAARILWAAYRNL